VHRVLARHDLVLDQERRKQATKRFERERCGISVSSSSSGRTVASR
jgi:hypothetical protein